jgi:FkbM family methyltransferase
LGQRIVHFGQYFQARFSSHFAGTVRFLAGYIPPGAVLFDVGANHGKFSIPLARLHGGSCKVYSFEPLEYNHTLLKMVLRSFHNVKIFPVALAAESGQTSLFVPIKKTSKRIGSSYGHLGQAGCERFFAAASDRYLHQFTIQTDTLDNVAAREQLSRLDFIKVDVEGAESLVFRGGLNSIAKHKPVIFCEIAPGLPERLGLMPYDSMQPLVEMGYRMFVPNTMKGTLEPCRECRPILTDYLFLHPANPATQACVSAFEQATG